MAKAVRLTWKDDSKTIVEECLLISEDDCCYVLHEDGNFEDRPELTKLLMNTGLVIFEDEEGIFCLDPDQVVEILEL